MKEKVILLVEDSVDDVILTLRAFKKNNVANEVIVARDGVEALDYLFCTGQYEKRDKSIMPALILLDLKMPRMDGLELLKRLRADKRTMFLPIVILTSSEEESDIASSYGVGANSYIRKPVDFNKFVEAVQHLELYWLILNQPLGPQ
jgi:two-component system, response regulator